MPQNRTRQTDYQPDQQPETPPDMLSADLPIIEQGNPLVLVVDDEQYAQMLLRRVLEREGFRVETASDGEGAINKAQTLRPDLIMMDVQMPGINGFEAVERLRSSPETLRIPIIVVTAAAREPTDVARGLGLGADDYMRKPFNSYELVARARSKIKAYHLEERLKQRTEELEALVRVGAELNQELALDELADRVVAATLRQLPATHALLILLNQENQPTLSRWHGLDMKQPALDKALAEKTLLGYTLAQGEAVLISDLKNDKRISAIFGYGMCVSGIATPLKHHGQILGVIALGDSASERFSEGDLRVLRSIAEQAALAIRNAQLYTELRGYAHGLEGMVQARTAALQSAQAQLLRTEKLAAVGTLAAGIAHEVNNPLQPVQMNLEMALEDIDAGRTVDRELLDNARQEVERIKGIVKRLLEFARPARSEMIAVNVNETILEVIALAGKQLEHSNVKVVTDLKASRRVRANPDQLKQVFLNLVINAMDAMPEGGQLSIHSGMRDDHVTLAVRDSGVGVPHEKLPQLFDPFFTTKPDGTGLGLSVSYGIIEAHGGQIEVESEAGKGTQFTIRLPVSTEK
jgi:two-component system NtrC family sensor kinase